MKDVALKIIPKKKVKGNEASVWGEMEVLKRCQSEQISIMASVSDLASSLKLLIHPCIPVGQWQVSMWRVVERKGDKGKSSRGC